MKITGFTKSDRIYPGLIMVGYSLILFYILIPHRNETQVVHFPFQPFLSQILLLLSILPIGHILINNSLTIKKADIGITFYLLYILARYCLSSFPANLEGIFETLTLFLLYLTIRSLPSKAIWLFSAILLIAALYRLAYSYGFRFLPTLPTLHLYHIQGGFINSGLWGGFLALVVTLLVGWGRYFILPHRSICLWIGWSLLTSFFSFLLFFADSRAGWLSALTGCLFLFYTPKRKRLLIITLCCLMPCLIAGISYYYKPESTNGRLLVHRVTLDMIADKPFLGFGPDGFSQNYMNYQADYFSSHPDTPVSELADETVFAFNEYLHLFTEQGVLGLIITFSLLSFIFIRPIQRDYQQTARILQGAIVALAVFCCFSYPFSDFTFKAIGLSLLALLISCTRPDFRELKLTLWNRIGLAGSILCLVIGAYPVFRQQETAWQKWNIALGYYYKNTVYSLRTLEEVSQKLAHNPVFLSTYGKALNRAEDFSHALLVLQQAMVQSASYQTLMELGQSLEGLGRFDEAEICWQKAERMIPNRFLPGYLTALMYEKRGEYLCAQDIALETLKKKIKVNTPEVRHIIRELKRIAHELNGELKIKNEL